MSDLPSRAGWTRLLALLLALLSCPFVFAQRDADMAVQAVRLQPGESIALDGSLSHPAWQRAPGWSGFVEKDPVNGAVPPLATKIQVLFDDRALYVGVTALDSDPASIRDQPVRLDQVNRTQDFVAVYIDAIGSRRSAQFFRVSAAGSRADGLHTAADDSEDFAPDFDWDAAVQRNAQGWTAVLRLPFASLRFAEGREQNWRIMVARRIPRQQFHLVASVPIPRETASFIDTMQPLRGIELPQRHHFLTLRPSLTLRQNSERNAGAPARRDRDVDLSLDLKYRASAEWVIDGTLNPDFSQVAIDTPQLAGNTRFSLFYPEKRPFFLESFDLLRTPSEALYTRSFTAPRLGLRATWRGLRGSGVAMAVDDRGGGLVQLPGAYGTGYAEQPASRTLLARARHDDGTAQWGAVLAARRYADGRGDNLVGGPDLTLPLGHGWRMRSQLLLSHTTAVAQGGQLLAGEAQDGHLAILRLNHNSGRSDTSITLTDTSAGFRHDSGFVNQSGVQSLQAYHGHGWFQVGPFNEFWVNLEAGETRERGSGQVVGRVIRPGIWISAARNLQWDLAWFGLSELRTAPDAPLLRENYVSSGLQVSPTPWWPMLDTHVAVGRLADTLANRVRPGVRWSFLSRLRPLRRLEVEPSLWLAWLEADGRKTYRDNAAQLLSVWHFDARRNLRLIVQRTSLDRRAEPGVDATRDAGQSTSLTYAWRHSSGTVMYLGASQSRSGGPMSPRVAEVFIKLQLDADDVRRRS